MDAEAAKQGDADHSASAPALQSDDSDDKSENEEALATQSTGSIAAQVVRDGEHWEVTSRRLL